jgi:uncharacterized protein
MGDLVSSLLPLFPLDVVLFPGVPLPLHIFEPRYKEMIGECLSDNSPFGIVRAVDQALAGIGCTAEIVTITKKYEDGRLDIVTEGRRRFEVLTFDRERAFLRAEVALLDDEPGVPAAAQADRAIQLHSEIYAMSGAVQDLSAADPATLSFYLAGSLPLDLDFKQRLLELRSENLRISALAEYLEQILPKLRRASRSRQKAGGNGHAQ